jgi:hypothetical protein
MAEMFDLNYLFGNMFNGQQQPNANLLPNQNPINIPQPGLNFGQNPMGARPPMGGVAPMQNPLRAGGGQPAGGMAPPPYAAAGIGPNNPPPQSTLVPGSQAGQQAGMPGARPGMDDSMRKMMLMQYLMGGEEGEVQTPNAASPSGVGLKGSGGFQNNPDAGLLNSFPQQLPPRKRFIGGTY